MADNHSHPTTGILHPAEPATSYSAFDPDIDMQHATDATEAAAFNNDNGPVMHDSTDIASSVVTNTTELENIATYPLANPNIPSPDEHAHDPQGFPVIANPTPISGTPNTGAPSPALNASDGISPSQAEHLRAFTQNDEVRQELQPM